MKVNMTSTIKKGTIIIVCVILLGILAVSSVTVIPTGYTGVKATFGQIDERTLGNGVKFHIPLIQTIEKVNNKQHGPATTTWGKRASASSTTM